MRYDPNRHHRRSIRLKGYDYAQPGAYFVTICVQDRECLLGTIADGEMRLNDAGRMVQSWWDRLPEKYPTVETDGFVIMPNHIHGIIVIAESDDVGANPRVRPDEQTHGSAPTLGEIVQWFKTMTTNAYIRGVKQDGWKPFPGKLWQRNYHERIVRNEQELNAVRRYIHNNPARWAEDMENPDQCPKPSPAANCSN
jgi:putative transposase